MLFSLLYMVLRVIFGLAPSGDERDREERSSSFAIRSRF